MNDIEVLILLAGLFLALFVAAELIHRVLHVQTEYTRKLVHTCTGLLTLLFPVWLCCLWQVLVLCGLFFVLLFVSLSLNLLPSINKVERKTAGSLLYPVTVVTVFLFYRNALFFHCHFFSAYYYFYLPLLIMAVCDPVAALAGKWYQKKTGMVASKTRFGSLAFFITALVLSLLLMRWFNEENTRWIMQIIIALLLSGATMIAERISKNGWDNFLIPLAAILIQIGSEMLLGS
jgi:phytol kinase